MMVRVRIWDLPTRFFHWTLVLCVIGLVVTGNVGGQAMVWHFRLGYGVLTLLIFRIFWGLVGGYWSRWSQLPLHPKRLVAYLLDREKSTQFAGHNPLGSWSIVAVLLFLALQVSTGLVSDDEISNAGPLTSLMSTALVSTATQWHKGWGKIILLVWVLIHLLALAWYRWRKHHSLLPAMWHGDKALLIDLPPSVDHTRSRVRALLLLVLSALVVAGLISLGA